MTIFHSPPDMRGRMLPLSGASVFQSKPYVYRGTGFDSLDRTSREHPEYHLHTREECGAVNCRRHRAKR